MKKYIIISALLLGLTGSVFAQDAGGPAAGDFSGAVLFGRGAYQYSGLDLPYAPGTNTSWYVSGSSPYLNAVSPGYNDVSNMLGVEGRYFFTDKVALKVSGGAILRSTPPRINIPANIDPSAPNATWLPAYNAVVQSNTVDFNLNIGGDYFFPSEKFTRVFPYVGANLPFFYGRRSEYDPTFTTDGSGNPYLVDIGLRHVEVIGFGLQSVAGMDYYVADGMFIGFEFKPISYIYTYARKFPAPGLEMLESDAHTWAFFNQIYFKLGFNF
jgi:opacity protein-like surface antigen